MIFWSFFVRGNAPATVSNIVAHEALFRLGIVSDLFCGTLVIFLVLAFYRLFRDVDLASVRCSAR